jgi:hypothetical protein
MNKLTESNSLANIALRYSDDKEVVFADFANEFLTITIFRYGFVSEKLIVSLGIRKISEVMFPLSGLSEFTIENSIAIVEDALMSLHNKIPHSVRLVTDKRIFVELSKWAGMINFREAGDLSIDKVEHLFNRLVGLVQGRPRSQDQLPMTPNFSSALLLLREFMHHLNFDSITILNENFKVKEGD